MQLQAHQYSIIPIHKTRLSKTATALFAGIARKDYMTLKQRHTSTYVQIHCMVNLVICMFCCEQ